MKKTDKKIEGKIPAVKKEKKISEKSSVNLESKVYSEKGKEVSEIKLPENIFGLNWNADLVHQVVTSMLSDARVIVAHTKDRGEVRGGGRKPWKQKGLGKARHGSSRSPIWVGGGVSQGPDGLRNYSRKINKKMKAKALFTILSKKYKEGEIVFVDKFNFEKPKTAQAIETLGALSKIENSKNILSKKNNSAIIATSDKNSSLEKSFSNVGSIKVDEFRNINPVDLLNYKYLVIENPEVSMKFIENKLSNKK
jgi:large subunit ribosomal protein L4